MHFFVQQRPSLFSVEITAILKSNLGHQKVAIQVWMKLLGESPEGTHTGAPRRRKSAPMHSQRPTFPDHDPNIHSLWGISHRTCILGFPLLTLLDTHWLLRTESVLPTDRPAACRGGGANLGRTDRPTDPISGRLGSMRESANPTDRPTARRRRRKV